MCRVGAVFLVLADVLARSMMHPVVLQTGTVTALVGATVMVIAHRLEVLCEADRIVARENGTVVESGQDEELANAGGAFAALLANQET